jgi:signal transduction histidine kinase
VSAAGDKREQEHQRANTMTREEAERLRELLRCTKPADLADLSVIQRIGTAIARAVYRPSKRGW